jgi:plastocyanin
MRTILTAARAAALTSALIAAAACGDDDTGPDDGGGDGNGDVTVSVTNNSFGPGSVTIAGGRQVTWTWGSGAIDHNIVPVATNPLPLPEDATVSDAPHSVAVRFTTPGVYKYYCQVHGSVDGNGNTSGMAGQVTVQ